MTDKLVALVLVLAVGCTKPTTDAAIGKDPVTPSATPTSPAPTATPAPAPSPAPLPGPPIVVTVGASFGAVSVRANADISVALRIEIEALVGGTYTKEPWQFHLIDACDGIAIKSPESLPPCRKLTAGEVVKPVPFTGYTCSSQCAVDCDKNAKIGGTIRYVVKSCDGKLRFESPPVKP